MWYCTVTLQHVWGEGDGGVLGFSRIPAPTRNWLTRKEMSEGIWRYLQRVNMGMPLQNAKIKFE
jgi:hypothetical protein